MARLAGLPRSLIARARQIMARLEVDGQTHGTIGQSIMDDLEGYGLLETLMTGIGADPEKELPPGVTLGTDSD